MSQLFPNASSGIMFTREIKECIKLVSAYLNEKLSPGQIIRFPPNKEYRLGYVGAGKAVWFSVVNVPKKFMDGVIRPGLHEIAERLNRDIIERPDARSINNTATEFVFYPKE